MTRWRQWSERTRSAVLVAAVTVAGVFAEWRSVGFAQPSVWLPDLAVGIVLALAGAMLRMSDDRRIGSLMIAAGLAWFAGNFSGESTAWVAWTASHLQLLHRAIIFHALAAFPMGRVRNRLEQGAIVAAYAGVLIPAFAGDEWWTVAWASSLFGVYVILVRRRTALLRAAGFQILPAMAVFSTVLVAVATILLALGDTPAPRIAVVTYQAGVVATAVFLLSRLAEWRRRTVEVADAVVEITFGPASNVRDLLAEALRDPSVEVVFAVDRDDVTWWVDEVGRSCPRLSAARRRVVPILVDGRHVAEVASNVDFEGLPSLLAAVESATRLAAEHARLRSNLRREIDLLAASRLRLLSAADKERVELSERLEHGAGSTLDQIRKVLDELVAGRDRAVDEAAGRSLERLGSLASDLDSLAAGLGPAALSRGGLGEALQQLADDSDVAVTVVVNGDVRSVPPVVASTLYFVCAEGIANSVRHAMAGRVDLTLKTTADCCTLTVADDGCGGADMSAGSGLQGLADRVDALGGQLELQSPVGAGTRLTVELPCG